MKKIFTLLILGSLVSTASAQLSLQYTNTRQAPASHNMTILDQVTDDNGNIYIVYSDDPSKFHLISKIEPGGATVWTDTVSVPGFPQVNVITAKINISQNKLYVLFTGYGQPGPAGPIVAIYDFNGNYINGFNASTLSNVWTYGVHGVHEKSNGNILVYYSYGDQFAANDTMYVKEFNPNFTLVWQLKYYVPKMTWFCPNTLTANGDFYFSYTNDSVVGAQHFLTCYTRKANNTGNVIWTNMYTDLAARYLKKMPNGDIAMTGNNNPSGSILGNNTGDVKLARLNDVTGDTLWTAIYNGMANEREEVTGLETDPLNNIFIVGTEDIHDYSPFINRGFLRKYNSSGQWQYERKLPVNTASAGVYLDALTNLNYVSVTGANTIHIKKMLATNGNTIDSISNTTTYPLGMSATSRNSNDDVFFSYSEAHCGGNHLEVKRFCTKAICANPDGLTTTDNMTSLTIYPNPASRSLSIRANTNERIEASIFTLSGIRLNIPFEQQQFDVSALPAGLYLMRVKTTHHFQTLRFTKE